MHTIGTSLLSVHVSLTKTRSVRCHRHKIITGIYITPLMRANLLDPQENLNDPEVGLTYKTPTEPKLLKKWRETLRKSLEG